MSILTIYAETAYRSGMLHTRNNVHTQRQPAVKETQCYYENPNKTGNVRIT